MDSITRNFLELYFEAIDDQEEAEKLSSTDQENDPEDLRNIIIKKIKRKKADLKIESGKILKEKVIELIKKKETDSTKEEDTKHYAIAARKLGSLDEQDIQSIKKDAELLEDIGKILKSKNES